MAWKELTSIFCVTACIQICTPVSVSHPVRIMPLASTTALEDIPASVQMDTLVISVTLKSMNVIQILARTVEHVL